MKNWRTKLALGITGVWAVSYVLAVVMNNYTGVGVITPVMIIAGTYLLSSEFVKRNGKK